MRPSRLIPDCDLATSAGVASNVSGSQLQTSSSTCGDTGDLSTFSGTPATTELLPDRQPVDDVLG